MMKVALVYDRINKWGGAERLLLALHELFPNAPLYTSVYNPKKAPWAKVFNIHTSFLQQFPFASSSHEYFAMLMPLAFESFDFDEYDVVISLSSEASKGIITKPETLHICYCLTPTRYLWSGYDEYFSNNFLKTIAKLAIFYLRRWDCVAAKRPDAYFAISKEVQKRIKDYYDRDSVVIYPPVTLGTSHQQSFDTALRSRAQGRETQDESASSLSKKTSPNASGYFLVVSRLVPYKKIDIVVEACNACCLPLKIVGSGSEERNLRQLAGPTISFLGNLTDWELVRYYRECRALIFPGIEDFGLTILEAQRFGRPVIAFRGGAALETIIEGKTGYFFSQQTKQAVVSALSSFEYKKFNAPDCIAQAEKFSYPTFERQFGLALEKLLQKRKL